MISRTFRTRTCSSPRTPNRRLAALLLTSWPLLGYAAQPPQTPTGEIEITISDVTAPGRLIRVAVNKAVLVDFSAPLHEVRLAKPDIAEVTATGPRQLLVTGRSFGTTQLIVWFEDKQQRVFDVAVDIELDRLLASIRTAVPRADVKAYALLDAVVLTGTVPDADAAARVMEIAAAYSSQVMNHMRVAGVQQVLLRCTVAEVNRSAARQLGFNGWVGGDDFRDVFFVNNLDGINPANIGAAADANIVGTVPFLTDREGIPIRSRTTLSFGFPRVQMQVFVQALRENGLLRIMAEPNLVAVSGQRASFLAGGELPIPIVTDERIKIEWKEFGVRLNFTPAVLSENVIRISVTPEVSELDFSNSTTIGGVTVPALTTRRVDTVIETGSGQTFAIGGLLNERTRAVSRKVPALGDVPILGALFSSVDFQSDETELLVLVTPELVEPVSTDQITAVPGATYVTPNDFELFLLGKLDGESAQPLPVLSPRVNQTWPVKPGDLYGPAAALKLRGPLGPAGSEEGM